ILSHITSFKLKLRLKFAKMVESPLDFLCFLLDAFQPIIEDHLALKGHLFSRVAFARCFPLDGHLCLFIRGEANQRIAPADVKIDVWQRLDIVECVDLGNKLEEEAKLTDFGGLLHDINAVEV